MSYKKNNISTIYLLLLLCAIFGTQATYGQEALTEINTKSTYHNQLFFNRFLINPTFSLVRENKSYVNILHRNQYATFEDNNQNYFLGFSNQLNENAAVGISVYSQWSGVVQEFGFNANYATAVKLGDESKLTFGTNVTYYTEGIDQNRIVVADTDTKIAETKKESKIAVQ
ncbi:PorP/SprF family type IX secretion system membrane protein [Zobellia laminariae]